MTEYENNQNYIIELRRGSLTLMVLGCMRKPHYGYALLQTLQDLGVAIEANTLYPLLRRLESQGLLHSDWDTGGSRPRKYYNLNARGEAVLAELLSAWQNMQQNVDAIFTEEA